MQINSVQKQNFGMARFVLTDALEKASDYYAKHGLDAFHKTLDKIDALLPLENDLVHFTKYGKDHAGNLKELFGNITHEGKSTNFHINLPEKPTQKVLEDLYNTIRNCHNGAHRKVAHDKSKDLAKSISLVND